MAGWWPWLLGALVMLAGGAAAVVARRMPAGRRARPRSAPAELDVHLIRDNYGTHKTPAINAWLQRHPRFHIHFTRPVRRGSTRSSGGSPSRPTR
jgi:hypothetical protein